MFQLTPTEVARVAGRKLVTVGSGRKWSWMWRRCLATVLAGARGKLHVCRRQEENSWISRSWVNWSGRRIEVELQGLRGEFEDP